MNDKLIDRVRQRAVERDIERANMGLKNQITPGGLLYDGKSIGEIVNLMSNSELLYIDEFGNEVVATDEVENLVLEHLKELYYEKDKVEKSYIYNGTKREEYESIQDYRRYWNWVNSDEANDHILNKLLITIKTDTQINISNNLETTERESLHKMILGMALSKYEYNPDAKRNYATGTNKNSIQASLDDHGIELHQDTIRDTLKIASETIDYQFSSDDEP